MIWSWYSGASVRLLPSPTLSRVICQSSVYSSATHTALAVGHLSDDELVAFLQRSQRALRQKPDGTCEGFIVIKENVCKDTDGAGAARLFDEDDSSITR